MCGCGRTSTDFEKAGGEVLRADVIEKYEGADHVPSGVRQHAPDFKASEIATALVDDIHAEVWGIFGADATKENAGPPIERGPASVK